MRRLRGFRKTYRTQNVRPSRKSQLKRPLLRGRIKIQNHTCRKRKLVAACTSNARANHVILLCADCTAPPLPSAIDMCPITWHSALVLFLISARYDRRQYDTARTRVNRRCYIQDVSQTTRRRQQISIRPRAHPVRTAII